MAESLVSEVSGAEFGDLRLTNRLLKIVDRLGKRPNTSIPAATDGRAEMEAAYRFFDNRKVSPEAIFKPHRHATIERARECDELLLVQDTTEIDLTRPSLQVSGAGPLEYESRRGAFYHPLMAFTSCGDVIAGAIVGSLIGWGVPRLHEIDAAGGDKARPAPGLVLGFRF